MKITCLLGSPRPHSNSAAIAARFLETAARLGAETLSYNLNRLTFRGCQACYTCKTKLDRCVLKDDLTEVLESVQRTDTLVIATPIYYTDVTGQLKCFIDRTYSFLKPDYVTNPSPSRIAPGKKLVFITTQGQSDPDKFAKVPARYGSIFKWYGFEESHLIRACGVGIKTTEAELEPYLKQAEETAKKIMGKGQSA
ncbi:MAG: flavodoxin family protein [bacterium]|nr:flavodoxin family protein [bacterium]